MQPLRYTTRSPGLAALLPVCLAALAVALGAGAVENPSPQADEAVLKAAGLATDDASLLGFFRARTLPEKDREKIAQLVRDLGSDAFEVRESATDTLVKLGARAVPLLNQAKKDPDIEVVRRAEYCLRLIDKVAG